MNKPMEIELNSDRGTQLELPFVPDSDQVSGTESVHDKKRAAIQRYLDRAQKDPVSHIETYSPGKRHTEYYRLVYRVGKKLKHIHIRGGSTMSELATYRANKLQEMIDRGAELAEILAALKMFNGGGK
ncbi:hypothetical protein I4641_23720 [Waterburya agarophytonicola K14]|uniref:Uncharacterized protein n=1 Tax=Waterburya agarophytonicola KI4 TaxID=2874699 RepID=A0A964BUY2_9CYAN|nr:hypothetical protein [Waterburya agarophytonicola]MCC0179940.1 hypothetical protein [Waterburya agarophytonicola KI4]